MKKILIIEDDDDILEGLELVLQGEGYKVKSLENADSFMEIVKEFSPDLIILDVLLSGVDGRDIAKTLKTTTETKVIPIIMVSAHPELKKKTRYEYTDIFIPKPFEVSFLLSKVKEFIQ